MMRPLHTLVFFALIGLLLLVTSFIFPDGGISVTENFKLSFVKPSSLFEIKKTEYADISHALQLAAVENLGADSLEGLIDGDTIRYNADSLRRVTFKLQFPANNRKLLFPFFEKIEKNTGVVRVLHFGDSQIEGDRVTSYLRYRLQQHFGGNGPGLLSAMPIITQTMSVNHEASSNWQRFVIFGQKDSTLIDNAKYGMMLSLARFSPYIPDSVELKDTANYEAFIKVDKSPIAYSNTKEFSKLRLFYGHNRVETQVKIYSGDVLIKEDVLKPVNALSSFDFVFDKPYSSVKIVFRSKYSPNIYGITLDGLSGVAVDNIPLRGSSGLEFTRGNRAFLAESFRQLNTGLIIMQFGVNVVPNIVEDYGFYERWFYGQLSALKKIYPDVPIVVVGISDMARKEGDEFVSYPNIEKIRNAQKNAAFKAECAFWDMYTAMGGKNSMPAWVYANPPLAGKDFTHFNYLGAKVISEMFYNAFSEEYNHYKLQKKANQ